MDKERKPKSDRSSKAPTRFIAVGGEFYLGGKNYTVERRGAIDSPSEACIGCSFFNMRCPEYIACSKFDRKDNTSVWFIEK